MNLVNYKKGINYEFGVDTPRNYKKALQYYQKAKEDGVLEAANKVKYSHFSIIQAIIIVVLIIGGIIIDFSMTFPWLGTFLIGAGVCLSSLVYLKKYWIRTGYAYITNIVLLMLSVAIVIPYSVIKPYLNGITWLPVTLLLVVGVFVAFSSIVLYFTDRDKSFIIPTVIGMIMLLFSIISFTIETPEKQFIFERVEDGIEITGYRSNKAHLVIPEKIIGYDVISIAANAFSGVQFETITFNNKIKQINRYAFSGNRLLTEIDIPDGVEIFEGAFFGNSNLRQVNLPNDLINIPSSLFKNNYSLKNVNIPNTVIRIGSEAFSNTGLSTIELPNNLEYLGGEAFGGTQIKSLVIPNTTTYLGPLSNMTHLETFNIPNQIEYLPNEFLLNNQNVIEFIVPNNIKSIGHYAFRNTNIENFLFNDNIETIGSGIFWGTKNLKTITLPETLTFIPKETFAYSALEEIVINGNIKEIHSEAFLSAKSLHSVVLNEGLRIIEANAFANTEALKEIVFPNSVIYFGSNTLRDSISLERVVLPAGLTSVPDRFLDGATKLKELVWPDSIVSVGRYAFRNTNLSHITLPSELETIHDYSFFGITSLESITFNDKLKSIGTHSFGQTSSLKVVDFPLSLTQIGEYSFNGSTMLEEVHIKQNVRVVGYWAFKGSPDLVVYIDNNPFVDSWDKNWNPDNALVLDGS